MKPNCCLIALVLTSAALGQEMGKPAVRELIGVLERAGASLHDKARACQQLGEFGTKEAVPALARLLPDPALSAYARSGLEGIPDASAAAALRAALATVKGNQLVGVVNSLGVLRDAAAVPALGRLATNEALLALGRIANGEAIAILRRTLSSGPEALRPAAASACLLAAEAQPRMAVELYDAVRAANVPAPYRLAATRGAILSRKSEGIGLLVKSLQSDDRETRNLALFTVREISAAGLGAALISTFAGAGPEVQGQLLLALADCCRDPQSLRFIRSNATAGNADVRAAALKALSQLGDPAGEPLLREGAEIDSLILSRLASAVGAAERIRLIELIDARPPSLQAVAPLLKLAGDPELPVTLAALRALRSLAGPADLPALFALTKSYQDGSQRSAAESVLLYASTRTTGTTGAAEALLAELNRAGTDLDRASWIRTLASLGYAKALPSILANLRSSNPWLVNTTIENLGRWPDAAPASELLGLAETTADAAARTRALTAAVGLAAADASAAAVFPRAVAAARSAEDKRAVIAGLARWRTPASFRLLTPYLDEAGLRAPAAAALLTVGALVAEGPDYAIVKPVLERLSMIGDPALADRIERLKGTLAATEAARRTAIP